MGMSHRWLVAIEECDLLSLDDSSRSRRLMSHAHESVLAGRGELRMRNDGADERACIALILLVQSYLG